MCQLFLANLGDKTANKVMIYTLASFGSDIHKHGFGIYHNGIIWKSAFQANKIINLGQNINAIVSKNTPVLAHIRLASKGVEIKRDLSHPFETENFELFHNGTLHYLDKELEKSREYTVEEQTEKSIITHPYIKSDSICFSEELEKEYAESEDIVTALQKSMEKFYGTFAFLIVERKTKKIYVVRGKTKTLFVSWSFENSDDTVDIKEENSNGIVIATEKTTLEAGIFSSNNISQLVGKPRSYFSTPELLKEGTIYELKGNSLEVLGEIKENPEPAKPAQKVEEKGGSLFPSEYNFPSQGNEKIHRLCKFMIDNCMTPPDIEILIKSYTGKFVIEISEVELTDFIDNIIPVISASKAMRKRMKRDVQTFHREYYKKYKIEFPWGINDSKVVFPIIKEIDKENNPF